MVEPQETMGARPLVFGPRPVSSSSSLASWL